MIEERWRPVGISRVSSGSAHYRCSRHTHIHRDKDLRWLLETIDAWTILGTVVCIWWWTKWLMRMFDGVRLLSTCMCLCSLPLNVMMHILQLMLWLLYIRTGLLCDHQWLRHCCSDLRILFKINVQKAFFKLWNVLNMGSGGTRWHVTSTRYRRRLHAVAALTGVHTHTHTGHQQLANSQVIQMGHSICGNWICSKMHVGFALSPFLPLPAGVSQ